MGRGMFSVSNLKKEQEANKNVASLFLNKLENAIVKLEPEYKPSNYYKPSSMLCKRQMYFTRLGITPEEEIQSASLIGICESGSSRHDRIQHVISAMPDLGMDFEYIDVETYVKSHNLTDIVILNKKGMETHCFNKRYNISFFTDGIIRHISQDKFYIFEYKTEATQKFTKRNAPDPIHLSQGAAYSVSFYIDDVIFVYEDRNFCNKKAFLYHVTEEDKRDKVIDKILEVENCVKENRVPPKITNKDIDPSFIGGVDRKAGPSAKVCQYCKFKKECSKYL